MTSNAAVWEVNAAVSGFVNSADTGRVSVTWDTSGCTDALQAAFIYEGNQGGALDSISARFGALSLGVVHELPKTRSGTIMRRLLRDVAEGRAVGGGRWATR
ncbi:MULTISPECIES: hypothetical protein [unclassified Rathayibacter]|uniref:hypothetical protein n=1 Tax=unclassified Rathayibacter TaxID=2609250 RepID=UPI00188BCCA0|nr:MULTISPECIES: hypothetical protein [unclassified Rathayibacter]MBF4462867.1 hypothetical protein [Rathayibacter sp. VKM Ac-2879]MBF4504281.1 hypothetical protein [Rathayibacter sp. VKM Ac-2878]